VRFSRRCAIQIDGYLYLYSLNIVKHSVSAGNLGRVDYVSEFEYDLFIRPDTCNARYRVWFYFTVENVKVDQVR